MNIILSGVLVLGGIGFCAALILYYVAQKFHTDDDMRVQKIEKILPGANCGGCGQAGCHDFAVACATSDEKSFEKLHCTVGGNKLMKEIADILGYKAVEKAPTVAVLRCQGSCQNAPIKFEFSGLQSCRLATQIATARSECPYGCMRLGDCVNACKFGALKMNPKTGLPEVDENKCVSCGACVAVCPKQLFEIRPKGKDGKRVYVACRNQLKGAQTRKNCSVACIACQKCAKINSEIKIENNLSYIPTSVDAEQYGEILAKSCPTGAIVYTGLKKENNQHED